jgi:hypothetical protein
VAGAGQFLHEDQYDTAELLARQPANEFTIIGRTSHQLRPACRAVPGPWARAE